MLIIIEGPDNGGKSTLVNSIRKRVPSANFLSMIGGRTETERIIRKRTWDHLLTYAYEKPKIPLLTERFHPISDQVYRKLFGGRRIFSDPEYSSICQSLAVSNSRIIYCRPPVDIARAIEHKAKGDDNPEWCNKINAKMSELFSEYDRVMLDLAWKKGISVIVYDYTQPISVSLEDSICVALI